MLDVDKLLLSLALHEGNRLYVYDDANGTPITQGYTLVGNPTIGTGRLLTKDKGLSIEESNFLLNNDVRQCIVDAQTQPWWINVASNDSRSRAIIEIVFNMGLSHLHTFIHTIDCLTASDFEGAATALLDSKWADQVGHRAKVLADQIRTGTG